MPGARAVSVSAFLEDPGRDASTARQFWRAEVDPGVVTVDALAAPHDGSGLIDPFRLGADCVHLVDPDGEHILWRAGPCGIRLDLRDGTFLNGPVRLRYALEGMHGLGHQLLTLRRLVGLHRLRRFPAGLFPRERRAPRWILLLRTLDALAEGATHRDIAQALFRTLHADWHGRSDFLRLRVQRLVRASTRLRDNGYLDLLSMRVPL